MGDMKAKMGVLKELRKMAMDDMGEPLKGGMKKVTVAAPDEKGLKMGLDKAEDMVEQPEGEEDIEESYGQEDDKAFGAKDDDHMQKILDMCTSPEEIDEKIQFLQKARDEMYPSEDAEESEPNPFEGM